MWRRCFVSVCSCLRFVAVCHVRPSIRPLFLCVLPRWGMDWVSSARSLSFSFFLSHCHRLSVSLARLLRSPRLSLITFTRKYYLYYVFCFLFFASFNFCNNSCILRDATVCVCVFVFVCVSLKRGFGRGTISPCNFKSPLSSRSLVLSRSRFHYACVVLLVCFCGGCDFILAIAQLLFCFFCLLLGLLNFFLF